MLLPPYPSPTYFLFLFNDPPPTEIYTLSLHDALPIFEAGIRVDLPADLRQQLLNSATQAVRTKLLSRAPPQDRKSTRLNSSHVSISYAVFCLKKKKHTTDINNPCKSSDYIYLYK